MLMTVYYYFPSQSDIDQAIENIRQTAMTLNIEDTAAGFL